MPVPTDYQRATDYFYHFLIDARDTAELGSTHQAFTMAQGVLQTFRRRLELRDAIIFSNALPAGLRALFTADWNPDEPRRPFEDRALMTNEVRELRADHNFSPDNAIAVVAAALRRTVDEAAFDHVLARLPDGAIEFWQP